MFEPMIRDGKILGYTLRRGGQFYFFGTCHTRRADLSSLFPKFEFCFLKQVHGRRVIEAKPGVETEADGHWTEVRGRALVSQSADCLPILLSTNDQICAIHAGWKGMAANILQAAFEILKPPRFVAIGPHILRPSFEIGRDVAETLSQAAPRTDPSLVSDLKDPQKALFDLLRLVHLQLEGVRPEIAECCFDTKSNDLFHSFRRDGGRAERQYSFVVLEA